MSDYAKPDVLVDTDWLGDAPRRRRVRVIEVDEDTTAYEKGHIRGAVGWNWTTDLHTKVGRDYIDQAGFAELLSAAGVGPDTTVVLYGGNNNWFAAYAYWLLKLRGFDDVKLLNGGRKKWELESRAAHAGRAELREHRHRDPGSGTPGDPRLPRRGHLARSAPIGSRRRALARGVPRREARARPPPAGAVAGSRAHRRGGEHPVGAGGERRRHVQERGRAARALRGAGHHRRPRGDRLLPDRRALLPHVVRAAGAAGLPST